jgi:hypothetical protein
MGAWRLLEGGRLLKRRSAALRRRSEGPLYLRLHYHGAQLYHLKFNITLPPASPAGCDRV